MQWSPTSPAERDGSPSCSRFVSPVLPLQQINHITFFTAGMNCEECSDSKEEQEGNYQHPSLHDL